MNRAASGVTARTLDGTVRVFLAEALILPTGLLTAAYLTRKLGPADYGVLSLAVSLVAWLQWSLSSFFTRASIQVVGESADWRPVGAVLLRVHLLSGGVLAVLVAAAAWPVANALREPQLTGYLLLLAPEVVLSAVVAAHRNLMVGTGQYTPRAVVSAARWLSRLALIVLFVEWSGSVAGALLGNVLASAVELIACRRFIRPGWRVKPGAFPIERLLRPAVPLFLGALCLRIFDKLDLFALKLLGGTAADAGYYVAAQNLAFVPSLVSISFSPLLLSSLCRLGREGATVEARELVRRTVCVSLWLIPAGAIAAGSAGGIVRTVYGSQFHASAPLFALLIGASIALVFVSVHTALLTAAEKSLWTFWLTLPLLPMACAGYPLCIPPFGLRGAALVTLGAAVVTAGATVFITYRTWKCPPAAAHWVRAFAGGFLFWHLATGWPVEGWLLLVKLSVLVLTLPVYLWLTGEFNSSERKWLWKQWPRRRAAADGRGGYRT